MTKFMKKPVIVEAIRYLGPFSVDEMYEEWGKDFKAERVKGFLVIHTLEGDLFPAIGDWIIKGVKGEFYPIKDDIFAETYGPVIPKIEGEHTEERTCICGHRDNRHADLMDDTREGAWGVGNCELCNCSRFELRTTSPASDPIEPMGSKVKFNTDFKKESDEFWKEIIYKDGKIDEEQVLKELADHYFMLEQIPIVYCHATGGLLSKQMYYASAVNGVITDYINRSIEEEIQSNIDEGLLIPTEEGLKYYDAKEEKPTNTTRGKKE
jgi:hypothetical protein